MMFKTVVAKMVSVVVIMSLIGVSCAAILVPATFLITGCAETPPLTASQREYQRRQAHKARKRTTRNKRSTQPPKQHCPDLRELRIEESACLINNIRHSATIHTPEELVNKCFELSEEEWRRVHKKLF